MLFILHIYVSHKLVCAVWSCVIFRHSTSTYHNNQHAILLIPLTIYLSVYAIQLYNDVWWTANNDGDKIFLFDSQNNCCTHEFVMYIFQKVIEIK